MRQTSRALTKPYAQREETYDKPLRDMFLLLNLKAWVLFEYARSPKSIDASGTRSVPKTWVLFEYARLHKAGC